MFAYAWPVILVVLSNVFYQICTKSVPNEMNPLASLTVTYLVGAVVSGMLYFILNRGGSLIREYSHVNWAPFVLGIVIVGLEVGFIYAYKAGWPVSTASLVANALLAVILLFVAHFIYGEPLNSSKIIGFIICLVGLYFINK